MRDTEFRAVTPVGVFTVPSDDFSLSLHDTGHLVLMWASDGVVDEFPVTELCQYTGLKDSNGVKIFEGDILANHKQGPRKVIYPMNEDIACFGLESADGWKNTLQNADKLYSVIGNIYENPELLNQVNKTH